MDIRGSPFTSIFTRSAGRADTGAKTAYFPELARQRTRVHAMHFSDVSSAVQSPCGRAAEAGGDRKS